MSRKEKVVSPVPQNSDVSIADILRKGNLSVGDPGPVTPPTAQISTGTPNSSANTPSSNSSGASQTSK